MSSIILTGNLSEGFRALGPFPDHDAAASYTLEGWIMTLEETPLTDEQRARIDAPPTTGDLATVDEIGDLSVAMLRAAEARGYVIADEIRLALFNVADDLVSAGHKVDRGHKVVGVDGDGNAICQPLDGGPAYNSGEPPTDGELG